MFTSLVVIDDLDFVHTVVTPDEAQPPLIVDADAASNLGALGKSSRSTYLKNTCPRKSRCSTGSSAAQSASLAALHAKPKVAPMGLEAIRHHRGIPFSKPMSP